jgi:hypothetical protein
VQLHLQVRKTLSTTQRVPLLPCLLLLAGIFTGAGCSEDDEAITTPACVSLIPLAQPADGAVVARLGADSSCDVAEIELVVTGVDDLLGAAFRLSYTANLAFLFQIDVDDSLLADGGVTVVVEAQQPLPGVWDIGLTRLSETGVDASADKNILVRLVLIRQATGGSGPFGFSNHQLLAAGPPDEPPVEIPPTTVPWFGGTLAIN